MSNPANPTNPTPDILTFERAEYAQMIENLKSEAIESYKKSEAYQKDSFGNVIGKTESSFKNSNPDLYAKIKELRKVEKDLNFFDALSKVYAQKSSNEDLEAIKNQYSAMLSEKDSVLSEREKALQEKDAEMMQLKASFAVEKLNQTFERVAMQKGLDNEIMKAGVKALFEQTISKEFDAERNDFVFKDKDGKVLLSKETDKSGNFKPKTYEMLLDEFLQAQKLEFSKKTTTFGKSGASGVDNYSDLPAELANLMREYDDFKANYTGMDKLEKLSEYNQKISKLRNLRKK